MLIDELVTQQIELKAKLSIYTVATTAAELTPLTKERWVELRVTAAPVDDFSARLTTNGVRGGAGVDVFAVTQCLTQEGGDVCVGAYWSGAGCDASGLRYEDNPTIEHCDYTVTKAP